MSNMNTEINSGIVTNISLVTANNFVVTKQSRSYLMSLLNVEEQKIFKGFVKQVSK